jgi:hypothetical protein
MCNPYCEEENENNSIQAGHLTKCYTIPIVCALAASMVGRAQQTMQIFKFKGSVFQKITVQNSGWYYLKASGGQGGESSNERHPGGAGAIVSGFFYLKANDSLRIAVGGMGQKGQNDGNNVSGGGGSTDYNGLPGLTTNKGGDAGLTMQNIPYYVFQAGGTDDEVPGGPAQPRCRGVPVPYAGGWRVRDDQSGRALIPSNRLVMPAWILGKQVTGQDEK